jgi:hypothetical protein
MQIVDDVHLSQLARRPPTGVPPGAGWEPNIGLEFPQRQHFQGSRDGLARVRPKRGQRLIRAAWEFHDLGRRQTVLRLLDEAELLDLEPGDRLRLSWYREIVGSATRSGARPLAALAGLAGQMRQDGDIDQALLTLENVALRCWWSNPDRRTRQRMTAVAEAVPAAGDDPRLLFVLALCDPAGHGAAVLGLAD